MAMDRSRRFGLVIVALAMGAFSAPLTAHAANGWRTYRNVAAGYTVKYPSTWTVQERAFSGGSFVTVFLPPHGGKGITVTVRPIGSDEAGADIPTPHCQRIQLHGLPGTRCFDTMAFSTTTTLTAAKATYAISIAGRQADYRVYNRLVGSFRLISQ